jgi:hypothetical protein
MNGYSFIAGQIDAANVVIALASGNLDEQGYALVPKADAALATRCSAASASATAGEAEIMIDGRSAFAGTTSGSRCTSNRSQTPWIGCIF